MYDTSLTRDVTAIPTSLGRHYHSTELNAIHEHELSIKVPYEGLVLTILFVPGQHYADSVICFIILLYKHSLRLQSNTGSNGL
jgi:hypothetical protein